MKGSWLRKSRATVLGMATICTGLLAWSVPANTGVYSPVPEIKDTLAQAELAAAPVPMIFRPLDDPATSRPQVQTVSAAGSMARAPRIPSPRLRPEAPRRAPREPLLPNLFGTVAHATNMTPANWVEHVAAGVRSFDACLANEDACGSDSSRWAATAEQLSAMPLRDRLARANRFVNGAISFRSDMAMTGTIDSWITPTQLFRARTGDCEDYALAKYWLLRASGVSEDDMFVMVVSDLVARAHHAYLAVRVGDGFVLLDSRTNTVLSPSLVDDINPLITIGARGAYLHGRRA